MLKKINISVRKIVEFVLRSGSIDTRYISMKRAYEGTIIHQRLQKRRKAQAERQKTLYEKEVVIKKRFIYEDFEFNVDGRADGILSSSELTPDLVTISDLQQPDTVKIIIEEIKSTLRDVNEIEDDSSHWHWAQLKCYGYMYASERGLQEISLRLTYCNVETEELAEFEYIFGIGELTSFFYQLIELYYVFANMDYERIVRRNETCRKLTFPYDSYRKNQREFAVSVYRTIKKQNILFAQAPTGTGKTISTIFPAVKALGEGYCSKVFYLTAKTITRQTARDSLAALAAKGLEMRSITLTAKDKICFCKGSICSPAECKYADGHFDRVNTAIFDIISNETLISRAEVEAYAIKHCICPFEYEFDIALFCDFIVCDYNYVYDPKVRLRRFFDDKNDFSILVDEAHNLVDRSREMFSADLNKDDYKSVKRILSANKNSKQPIVRQLNKIIAWFKTCEKDELPALLNEFIALADVWLAVNEGFNQHAEVLDLYFKTLDYLRTGELFDSRYIFYTDITKQNTAIKLLCLDPSYLLSLVHKRVGSTVFFSATMTPPLYFRDVLGGDEKSYSMNIPSPFECSNLAVFADTRVSAKYSDRSNSLDIISKDLQELVNAKKGNYFAFFPSYEYMNSAYAYFTAAYPGIETVRQTNSMSEEEREAFINLFTAENQNSLLGFVVMGGVFSESIDLYGDKLIGAAIISVGLPLITKERNILMDYYKSIMDRGFEYAYIYPGMIKVMQAAGRVIRSETDRGAVLLLDARFMQSSYRPLLPKEWSNIQVIRGDGFLTAKLTEFWG